MSSSSYLEAPPGSQTAINLPGSLKWWKSTHAASLNPFKKTYFSLYDPLESTSHKTIAISSAVLAVIAGIPLPIIGYLLGQVINEFPPHEKLFQEKLIQLLGVAVGYFIVTVAYTTGFGLTAEHVSLKLRTQLLKCLLHLDQAYLDTHNVDVNGLLTEKMDTIKAGCSEKVGILIQAVSYFLASFVVGFILDARLTGILLASVVPAILLCFLLFSPAISRYSRRVIEQDEKANTIVESALGAVRTVQAFDMVAELCKRHSKYLGESTRLSVKKSTLAALQAAFVFFLAYSTNSLAFFIGSRIASGGNAGTVYAVVFLILDASAVVGQFAPFLDILARAAAAKEVVQGLLDAHKSSLEMMAQRSCRLRPELTGRDVSFEDVSFQYPARPTIDILRGVNLRFKAGSFVAVVGTSGGGKSTLIALLMGVYDYSGIIKIGPHSLKALDSVYLKSQISLLDQDSALFTGSIFDNVCYGLVGEDLPMEEKRRRCEEAFKMANVDFLSQLPQGMHTHLGNDIQLSGGQRQRVCLARALINRPSLLILDEPTSALDAGSEEAVMTAVKKAAVCGTTVFMVAHRLSTTLDADYIAVVNDGKVVEQGTPCELSSKGTIFRGLLDAQTTSFAPKDQSDHMKALENHNTHSLQADSPSSSGNAEYRKSLRVSPLSNTYNLYRLAKRIAQVAKPEWWVLIAAIIASTLSGGIMLGQALVFGNLVTVLNDGTSSPSYHEKANLLCLAFFLLALLTLISYSVSGGAFGFTAAQITCRVQAKMLIVLLHLDIQWFLESGHSVHELMSKFTKDPGDFSALGGVALGSMFTMVTSIFAGIILAHVIAWKIALVLLAAVPIVLTAGWARLRILTKIESRQREAYTEPTSLAAEACRNRRTVTALCLQERLLANYQNALQQPYRQVRTFVCYSNTLFATCLAIPYFLYALAYWWGSKQVRAGAYTTTDFFVVLPALLFSAQSAGYFFSLSPEMARAKAAARSIFSVLDAKPCIMQPDDLAWKSSEVSSLAESSIESSSVPGEKHLADGIPKLELRNVSLRYYNSSTPSLRDVSLLIPVGKTVAFVGPSGAGKSSIIALIERFYDTTQGTLFFNGVDIRSMDVRTLRGHIGLVSQDPNLFSGSISDNVKLGAPTRGSVSDADVEAVCRKCGLHDFITSLPEGYNTECGSSSSSHLSGGQKQRLAIARALVRNPEILLLDEPMSALDAHSEARVQATLSEASKNRTTVIVAHRLASIRHVDRIFLFDQGRLIAEGTHAELVEQGGLYASMAKAQSLV